MSKDYASGNLPSPIRNFDCVAIATRDSLSSTGVTVRVTVTQGFGSGAVIGESKTALRVSFQSTMNATTKTGVINPAGTSWKYTQNDLQRLNSNGSTMQGRPVIKSATTVHEYGVWTNGNAQPVTIKFFQDGSTEGSTVTLSVPMPDYSAGTTTTIGNNTITSSNAPNITTGQQVTINYTAVAGNNNSLGRYEVLDSSNVIRASGNQASTSGSITFSDPNTANAGQYTYSLRIYSGVVNQAGFTLRQVTVTVTRPTLSITSASVSPTEVPTTGGGDVTIYATTNAKTSQGYSSSFAYSVNNGTESYDFLYTSVPVHVPANSTIKVWAYDGTTGQKSSTYKTLTVRGYTPISIGTFNVTASTGGLLKDNSESLDTPSLVNKINGTVTASGGTISSYYWQYAESSTKAGLNTATFKTLNVSSQSFNNLNMTSLVTAGNYYKVKVTVTNSEGRPIDSNSSTIFQMPAIPGTANITSVIAKTNPEEGYEETIVDGKTYFGSGIHLAWTNPEITASHLPIANISIIYQYRSSSTAIFQETKEVSIASQYINKTSLANNSHGEDLEVPSLYETKVGIRITDTLGQSNEIFYATKNYYKAESPSFGGNLNTSLTEFRPFTCIEGNKTIFTSDIASSNSQDELLYTLECYVGDRNSSLITIFEDIPISTESARTGASDAILYGAEGDPIIAKKGEAQSIKYEIKNSVLKNAFLSNAELREIKNGVNAVYNDNFTNVVYKISVKDDFDSSTLKFNSPITSINFIEAPFFGLDENMIVGVNRYVASLNPFTDGSINLLNSESTNSDRIVNPNENIIFKFKPAKDFNGTDYSSIQRGDIVKYNLYVSRNNTPPISGYDELGYTLLKSFNIDEVYELEEGYWYISYPFNNCVESNFDVFRLQALDSKSLTSQYIYGNTYVVPCRATQMDFYINSVNFSENNQVALKTKITDLGGTKFIEGSSYGYDKENDAYSYPNFERSYTIGEVTFNPKCTLKIEASLDGTFESGNFGASSYENYFTQSFSLESNLNALTKYTDFLDERLITLTSFPAAWINGIIAKDIKKIFFKATYIICYGLADIEASDIDKYLKVISVSAPYSYYDDAPTMSYRNHQVGINTKDFNSAEGAQKEVLIVQDNGSYNLVVFQGAESKLFLNLTERTFYIEDNESSPNRIMEINFDDQTINGVTIDGGNW